MNATQARKPLTPKQAAVYDFLLAYTLENHRQPTVRETAEHYGCVSSYALAIMKALFKKGWLEVIETGTATDRWKFADVVFSADRTQGDWPEAREGGSRPGRKAL